MAHEDLTTEGACRELDGTASSELDSDFEKNPAALLLTA